MSAESRAAGSERAADFDSQSLAEFDFCASVSYFYPNLVGESFLSWGRSSVGRALEWHSRGRGFDSLRLHHPSLV